MSVEIARRFIQMRKFILENGDALLALAKLQNRQIEFENETNKKFDEILKFISKADLPKQAIFRNVNGNPRLFNYRDERESRLLS